MANVTPTPGVSQVIRERAQLLFRGAIGVLLCVGCAFVMNGFSFIVGMAYTIWSFFGWEDGHAPRASGSALPRSLSVILVAGYFVMMGAASFNASNWYLNANGRETSAVIEKPESGNSHGKRHYYCRVRLPDRDVRQVDENKRDCWKSSRVGENVDVVYDPADIFSPTFGTKRDLGVASSLGVFAGAGVLELVGPVTSVLLFINRRKKDTPSGEER